MKKICRLIFPIYLFFVFWITLIDRIPRNRRSMLTPFWEYRELLTSGRTLYWLGQIGGNLMMLLPLGFLLPEIGKRLQHFIPVLLIALCLSVFIEVTQYFTGRGLCEFDDVFHNTIGAVAGYVIWKKKLGRLKT
ncbi:MAG: VanZ family protein [Ruminococcus sp.]